MSRLSTSSRLTGPHNTATECSWSSHSQIVSRLVMSVSVRLPEEDIATICIFLYSSKDTPKRFKQLGNNEEIFTAPLFTSTSSLQKKKKKKRNHVAILLPTDNGISNFRLLIPHTGVFNKNT